MRRVPLFERAPQAAVEVAEQRDLDKNCTRCPLHEGARAPCLGGEVLAREDHRGGLLVVGEAPGREEDMRGRPFIGPSGNLLRQVLAKHWTGPIVLDNALRCYPRGDEVKDKYVAACRGYLTQTILEAQPRRIVTVGGVAASAVLGRTVLPFSTRRGFSFLTSPAMCPPLGLPVPVFMVAHPAAALRNRFVRKWFEADMAWALTATVDEPDWEAPAWLVDTERDAEEAVDILRRSRWASFDVETCGCMFDPSFRMLSVSLCGERRRDAYVWTKEGLADEGCRNVLLRYLADPRAHKVGQNVKFDTVAVYAAFGVLPKGIVMDTRLARKLLESEADGHLERMAELVGMGGHKEEAEEHKASAVKLVNKSLRIARKANAEVFELDEFRDPPTSEPALDKMVASGEHDSDKWSMAFIPRPVLYRYNGLDAVTTTLLGELLQSQLVAEPDLHRTWQRLVMPASAALAHVEAWGIGADRDAMMVFDNWCAVRERELGEKLNGFKRDVNWGSPQQVADILFRELGLNPPKKTKGGADSTDADVLEQLQGQHPLPGVLLEYRRVSKMRGTYASGMMKHVRADGRIHPSLNLDGARSGRTSSSDPNLQNIPRAQTEEGTMARNCFCAAPGNVLVEADYSQIELRVAAALSGDADMQEIFKSGVDYHLRTAQLVSELAWGIKPEEVQDKHRSDAKSINFGVLYGMGDKELAAKMGCRVSDAARIKEAILGKFRKLDAWCKECLAESRRTGEAWTWWDGQRARRRNLWRIADQDDLQRSKAEHSSWNTPIQGTASDFLVASLAAIVQWIHEDAVPAKVVVPVHDSIMLEVREADVPEVVWQLRHTMQGFNLMGVPLVVDFKIGRSWGALQKVKGD